MSKDYLGRLQKGSHFLCPLLDSMIEDAGVENAYELRDVDPEQLSMRICVMFNVPNPVEFSELLVKVYAQPAQTGNETYDQVGFVNAVVMLRKYAAYALGQLGYKSSIEILDRIRANDPAPGVRQAAAASLVAIAEAPADEGYSEEQRLPIIERAYKGSADDPLAILRDISVNHSLMVSSDDKSAREYATKVVGLAEKMLRLDPDTEESTVLWSLGSALWILERHQECIQPLEEALHLFEQSKNLTPALHHTIHRQLGISLVISSASIDDENLESRALWHLDAITLDSSDSLHDLREELRKRCS